MDRFGLELHPPLPGSGDMVDTAKIQDIIRFGDDFELDTRNYQLRRAGRALKLEKLPMEILLLLVMRAGHLVTREEIVERIWGKNALVDTDNSINSAVRKIRQVLRDNPDRPRFVETIVGRGYIFSSSQVIQEPAMGPGFETESQGAEGFFPGRRIGDYRLVQVIGAGGMGVIYRAEDLKLGRQVAIKLLPAELTHDAKALERMQREACIASSLNHPNICPIYQLAEFDGQPFFVMPLLEGTTLREWIEAQSGRSAGTCIKEILDVAIQIIEGLKAAHSTGTIHRDIKPANIFVTTNGEVKILDFGVARINRAAGRSGAELEGYEGDNFALNHPPSTGTPFYLSPEQVRGEPVDEQSDIFSFGSVLYEMSTGRRAFARETVSATKLAILESEPEPIVISRPGLPPRLDEIVRKTMERDRGRRYQSAAEVGADLVALRAELTSPAGLTPAPPLVEAAARWPRAAILKSGAIGLGIAALIGGAVAWIYSIRTAGPQPFREFSISQITNTGRAEQVAISPDGKYLLHVQGEGGLRSLRLRNIETGSDAEVLAPDGSRFKSLTFSPDGNYVYFRKVVNSTGSEWDYFRMPVLGGKPEALLRDVDSDLAFSPDGKKITYVRANDPDEGRYRILTANLDGTDETLETVQKMHGSGTDAYPPFDTWSPDGKRILYTFAKMADEPGVMRVFNIANRSFETFHHFPDLLTFDVHSMPDGKWLLLVASQRGGELGAAQISAFSLVDRKLRPVTRDANNYSSLSIAANGRLAAAVQTRSFRSLDVVKMEGSHQKVVDSSQVDFGNLNAFEWEDAGHILASDGSRLFRIDTATKKSTELFVEKQGAIVGLAHCSSGTIILNREFRTGNVMSEIWKLNEDGSNPVKLSDGEYDTSPACSPDGKAVYYLEGTQQVKRVDMDGHSERVDIDIPHLDRVLGTFAFSTDGSRMTALVEVVDPMRNRAEARLAVFQMKEGAPSTPLLLIPDQAVNAGSMHSGGVRFSPDGRQLVYQTIRNGVGNLWEQSLDSAASHALTDFPSGTISHFRFSPQGVDLAIDRSETIADVVLLRDESGR